MEPFPISAPAFSGNSRVVAVGSGFDWLKQGWAVFVVNPGLWIVMTIVMLVVIVGLQIVPLIGTLAANLLTPLLLAGMLQACRKISNGQAAEINDLFVGFKQGTSELVMLGVLYMVAMLIIYVVVLAFGGGSLMSGLMMGRPAGFGVAFGGVMLAMLLSLVLSVPLFMAFWFAPALVFFNNMPPVEALKASFNACLKNTVPFLVYGLIVLVLGFFAALPLGLGYLVLVPVLFGSVYASYRDVFVAN